MATAKVHRCKTAEMWASCWEFLRLGAGCSILDPSAAHLALQPCLGCARDSSFFSSTITHQMSLAACCGPGDLVVNSPLRPCPHRVHDLQLNPADASGFSATDSPLFHPYCASLQMDSLSLPLPHPSQSPPTEKLSWGLALLEALPRQPAIPHQTALFQA